MRPAALVPREAIRELPDEATATSPILEGDVLVSGRLADGPDGIAPRGTTAIRLDLAVTAPELTPGDMIDILGPGETDATLSEVPDLPTGSQMHGSPQWKTTVEVISRDAVVLRPPGESDPTVEVAVTDSDLESVAGAALDGRVVVVRRSP